MLAKQHSYRSACCIYGMSNQTTQYKKKCTRCSSDILMSNLSGKWKAMETNSDEIHRCSGSNSKNSSYETAKPDSRPSAFVTSNNNNNIQQQQDQQLQQQQQISQVFSNSVKLEQAANGQIKISCHVYRNDLDSAANDAIELFAKTRDGLVNKNMKVLTVDSE